MNLIPYYAAYAAASLAITMLLARTLFRNGAVFLADTFGDRPELASAVNQLLVTGFFMLNLGYAMFLLQIGFVRTPTEAVEAIASNLGVLLVSLAVIHFVNLLVFNRIRAHSRANTVPPLPPTDVVMPPPPSPLPGGSVMAGPTTVPFIPAP